MDQAPSPHSVQQKGSSDDDEQYGGSSKLSPVVPEKKLGTKMRSLTVSHALPVTEAPRELDDVKVNDVTKKLQEAAQQQALGRQRWLVQTPSAATPSPPAPTPAPVAPAPRKPPTEPRHGRSIAPINTAAAAAEEGEITSSPVASPAPPGGRNGRSLSGPLSASSTAPPTKPRFQGPPSARTPPRVRTPPPPSPFSNGTRPPLMARVGPPPVAGPSDPQPPTGPRALRGRGAPGPRGWDERDRERERDRGWGDRDRERYRDRDDRDRDRDRDRRWDHGGRGRGRGRGWGGR